MVMYMYIALPFYLDINILLLGFAVKFFLLNDLEQYKSI